MSRRDGGGVAVSTAMESQQKGSTHVHRLPFINGVVNISQNEMYSRIKKGTYFKKMVLLNRISAKYCTRRKKEKEPLERFRI